jgi:hypothetical protein
MPSPVQVRRETRYNSSTGRQLHRRTPCDCEASQPAAVTSSKNNHFPASRTAQQPTHNVTTSTVRRIVGSTQVRFLPLRSHTPGLVIPRHIWRLSSRPPPYPKLIVPTILKSRVNGASRLHFSTVVFVVTVVSGHSHHRSIADHATTCAGNVRTTLE